MNFIYSIFCWSKDSQYFIHPIRQKIQAPEAQADEQGPFKPEATGSRPVRRIKFSNQRWRSAMGNSNKRKSEQLKMHHGTAANRLRKSILFDLVKRLRLDECYQCGKLIETIAELSIEHKIPWLDSDDPVKNFFDLDNIAFSHRNCNIASARRGKHNGLSGEQHSRAKLSLSDVERIRIMYAENEANQYELAEQFGVHQKQISRIVRKENWN